MAFWPVTIGAILLALALLHWAAGTLQLVEDADPQAENCDEVLAEVHSHAFILAGCCVATLTTAISDAPPNLPDSVASTAQPPGEDDTPAASKKQEHHRLKIACRDLGAAYLMFELSVAQGEAISPLEVNHLMFQLTKGHSWAALIQRANKAGCGERVDVAVEDVAQGACTPLPCSAYRCVERLYSFLQEAGHDTVPATVLLVRAAVQAGDLVAAERVVTEVAATQAKGMVARHFTPILMAWAARREPHRAVQVVEVMKRLEIAITLEEYTLLLESCVGTAPYSFVEGILMHMQADLEGPLPTALLDHVRAYFEVPPGWTTSFIFVEKDGEFRSPRGRHMLQQFEAPAEDVLAVAHGIEALACMDEVQTAQFCAFKDWLARIGGCDVTIDGANVALFQQSHADGRFQFAQIKEVYDALWEQQGLERRVVILRRSRVVVAAELDDWAPAFLEELQAKDALFIVDSEKDDDLFWAYAAMVSGGKCVSNDNLVDIMQQMNSSPTFEKWYRQRRIRYDFNAQRRARLLPPVPFTTCVQAFPDCWMLPAVDKQGQWLQVVWDPVEAERVLEALSRPVAPPSAVQHPVLGIDWGRRRVGLAATDKHGTAAFPICTVWRDRYGRIQKLVAEMGIKRIVIGLPKRLDKTDSERAREVRVFHKRLQQLLPDIPIKFQNERMSSKFAAEDLHHAGLHTRQSHQELVDQLAAMDILRRHLTAEGCPVSILPISALLP